jgi:hypothetical protein
MLSGVASPRQSGLSIQILSRPCGQSSFRALKSTKTGTGGAWKAAVKPTQKTAYRAKVQTTLSRIVVVNVRPRITLTKVAAHKYKTLVYAARSFANHTAVFQRWSLNLQQWVRVRYVILKFLRNGTAPTIVSGRTFPSTIVAGKKVRIVLPYKQAQPCYLSGWSYAILS